MGRVKTPENPMTAAGLEMVFFGRLIKLPLTVTREHWDAFVSNLQNVAEILAAAPVQRLPRSRSAIHYRNLAADIMAVWALQRDYGPQAPLAGLMAHIRTLEAVSKIDHDGITLWTGPALEDASAWAVEDWKSFQSASPQDLAVKAMNMAKKYALETSEVKALPALLQDRSVSSLNHLPPDMVLRILDGIAQFEASANVPAAVARSFRRALEVLCPELPLPLGGESQIITMPPALVTGKEWGLKPKAVTPADKRRRPSTRRGPSPGR